MIDTIIQELFLIQHENKNNSEFKGAAVTFHNELGKVMCGIACVKNGEILFTDNKAELISYSSIKKIIDESMRFSITDLDVYI